MFESSRFAGAGATDENQNELGVMDVCSWRRSHTDIPALEKTLKLA